MSEIPKIVESPSIGYVPGKGWVKIDVDGKQTLIDAPPDEVLGKPLMYKLRKREIENG